MPCRHGIIVNLRRGILVPVIVPAVGPLVSSRARGGSTLAAASCFGCRLSQSQSSRIEVPPLDTRVDRPAFRIKHAHGNGQPVLVEGQGEDLFPGVGSVREEDDLVEKLPNGGQQLCVSG